MSFIRQCINVSGPKKTVVVFDGGGVRGRFALEICCTLANKQSIPLSQLFSMIVGVSAGAMVGTIIALGWLDDTKTSKDSCSKFYKHLPEMFETVNRKGRLLSPKYNGTGKTIALKRMLGKHTFADVLTPLVIMCCDLDGTPVPLCSWDPALQEVLLADALDASSAAPTFFPPVFVHDQWLCDGGVRANKPLIHALLLAIDFFDRGNLWWLSIGTSFSPKRSFSATKAAMMGILAWLKHGLIEILLGGRDDTSEKLMRSLFQQRFIRLECQCDDIKLDNYSSLNQTRLDQAAKLVWNQQSEKILFFVDPSNISQSSSSSPPT